MYLRWHRISNNLLTHAKPNVLINKTNTAIQIFYYRAHVVDLDILILLKIHLYPATNLM
jgi:hypothetical protein